MGDVESLGRLVKPLMSHALMTIAESLLVIITCCLITATCIVH